MTFPDDHIAVVLRRPATVPAERWMEVFMAACCQGRMPGLDSFSVGEDRGTLTFAAGPDRAQAAAFCGIAVEALMGELACPSRHAPAPAPRP